MQQRKQRLTQNSHKLNWLDFNIDGIIGGKTSDGVRYLELFLKDYKKEFNNTTLNANCRKCLNDYLRKYKDKYNIMDSKCDYILHKKREGIQLGFGSSVFVNNNNITNEYAKKLVSKFKKVQGDSFEMSFLFSKYPKEVIKKVEEPKKIKRTRKNKK